jgi:hypothetical protein
MLHLDDTPITVLNGTANRDMDGADGHSKK